MWEQMLEYFCNNPIYFYIAVALVAAILLVIIIAIAVGVKRSKKRKAAARAAKSEAASAAVQPKETATSAPIQTTDPVVQQPAPTPISQPSENAEIGEKEAEPVFDSTSAFEEKPGELNSEDNAPESPALSEVQPTEDSAAETAPVQNEEPAGQAEDAEQAKQEPAATAQPAKESRPPQPNRKATQKNKPARKKEDERKQAPAAAEQKPDLRGAETRVASRAAAEKLLTTEEDERKTAYAGKWVILKNDSGMYYFELRASNGEKLLSSIDYTSVNGAKNGIKTHKTNIQKNNIVISQSKNGSYFFRLLNGSKQLLCTGENYPSKSGCESAVDSVRRFAETAVISVQDEESEN